jgi:hypothetical protein
MAMVPPRRTAVNRPLSSINSNIIINYVSLLLPTETNHNTILNEIEHEREVDKNNRNKETAAAVRKCVHMFDVSRCVRIWIFSLLPYEAKKKEEFCNHDNQFFFFIKVFLSFITH